MSEESVPLKPFLDDLNTARESVERCRERLGGAIPDVNTLLTEAVDRINSAQGALIVRAMFPDTGCGACPTTGAGLTELSDMSHLRELAAKAAADAQGDFDEAFNAFVLATEALPPDEYTALYVNIPEAFPTFAEGVREALIRSRGDVTKAGSIIRERYDPRENPAYVEGIHRDIREKIIPAFKAAVREACETFKKGDA